MISCINEEKLTLERMLSFFKINLSNGLNQLVHEKLLYMYIKAGDKFGHSSILNTFNKRVFRKRNREKTKQTSFDFYFLESPGILSLY